MYFPKIQLDCFNSGAAARSSLVREKGNKRFFVAVEEEVIVGKSDELLGAIISQLTAQWSPGELRGQNDYEGAF